LPPAWIGVGTLDLFYEEALTYGRRLRDAGTPSHEEVAVGAFHTFDVVVPKAPISRTFFASQCAHLRAALVPEAPTSSDTIEMTEPSGGLETIRLNIRRYGSAHAANTLFYLRPAPLSTLPSIRANRVSRLKPERSVVAGGVGSKSRPRGRPRLTIDRQAVADAVAELLHEGGYEAVGIPEVAEKLSVSRATLYRTVPTKVDLMGILFERSTRDLGKQARAAIAASPDSREQLTSLIGLQADAAVRMRRYMTVFFGGGDLPPEVFARWRTWSRRYENMWVKVVAANMRDGNLAQADPVVTTRLILGMLIWVSRWHRPIEKVTPKAIADTAIHLLGMQQASPGAHRSPNGSTRRSTVKKKR
jgi:AcrR family transcriptional regulator